MWSEPWRQKLFLMKEERKREENRSQVCTPTRRSLSTRTSARKRRTAGPWPSCSGCRCTLSHTFAPFPLSRSLQTLFRSPVPGDTTQLPYWFCHFPSPPILDTFNLLKLPMNCSTQKSLVALHNPSIGAGPKLQCLNF